MPFDARYTGGATRHPSSAITTERHSSDLSVALTQVLGARRVNEVRGELRRLLLDSAVDRRLAGSSRTRASTTARRSSSCAATPSARRTPTRTRTSGRRPTSFRDNLTFSFDEAGRHDVKVGGEYVLPAEPGVPLQPLHGHLRRAGRPGPGQHRVAVPGVERRLDLEPRGDLADRAQLHARRRPDEAVRAAQRASPAGSRTTGRSASRLTLNLGVRYDLDDGRLRGGRRARAVPEGRPRRTTRTTGRRGSAPPSALNDKTVMRGGAGRFFADPGSHTAYWTKLERRRAASADPQRRPGGLRGQPVQRADPDLRAGRGDAVHGRRRRRTACGAASARSPRRTTRSPTATRRRSACSGSSARRCRSRPTTSTPATARRTSTLNVNLAYDPATGVNYPFTNISQAAVSGLGLGEQPPVDRRVQLPRPADGVHQAHEQPLAGVGDLPARRASGTSRTRRCRVGCEYPTTLNAAGAAGVRRARSTLHPSARRGVVPDGRPAPSRRRSTASGTSARLPGERPVPLRRQRLGDADLGRRRPADRRTGAAACAPTARSSRATASTCRRCTAWTCALQKRFAVGRREGRRHRRSVQRLQPRQLRQLRAQREQRALRPADART